MILFDVNPGRLNTSGDACGTNQAVAPVDKRTINIYTENITEH